MGEIDFKGLLTKLSSTAVVDAVLILAIATALVMITQWLLPRLAERFTGKTRLYLLAAVPMLRLVIIVVSIVLVIPTLIEPTFKNLVAIFGALGLALGFAFKDYANSLIAGVVTLYEMPYRPGDWIEVDGQYGEVRSIGMRAAEIVTPDDSVVVIPHNKLWNSLLSNANDGTQNLMCVADFYLDPDHDAVRVRRLLQDVLLTSPYLKTHRPALVVLSEKPWGTHYRVKGYPIDPRDQFHFVSDVTTRGKVALRESGVRFVTVPTAVEPR